MTNKIKCELRENVVTTDYVEIITDAKPGDTQYILHYFTFATCWTDKENIKQFKTITALKRFYGSYLKRGDVIRKYRIDCCED